MTFNLWMCFSPLLAPRSDSHFPFARRKSEKEEEEWNNITHKNEWQLCHENQRLSKQHSFHFSNFCLSTFIDSESAMMSSRSCSLEQQQQQQHGNHRKTIWPEREEKKGKVDKMFCRRKFFPLFRTTFLIIGTWKWALTTIKIFLLSRKSCRWAESWFSCFYGVKIATLLSV